MPNRLLSRSPFRLVALDARRWRSRRTRAACAARSADTTGAVSRRRPWRSPARPPSSPARPTTDTDGGFFFATVRLRRLHAQGGHAGLQDVRSTRASASARTTRRRRRVAGGRRPERDRRGDRRSARSSRRRPARARASSRAEQIENISIIGRNPMELLRILPGVVAPTGQLRERQATAAASAHDRTATTSTASAPQQQRGDARRRATCSTSAQQRPDERAPNNDFVAEVKVQIEQLRGRVRHRRRQGAGRSPRAAAPSSTAPRYDYLRHHKFAANDRARNYAGAGQPKRQVPVPRRQRRGPILIPGTDFNKDRDKAFFFLGVEWRRQNAGPGPALRRGADRGHAPRPVHRLPEAART